MKKLYSRGIISIAVFLVIVISAYFINVEVQSYRGRQALAATGLVSLPFDEALKTAKTENKLVFVDVSAIWCPTCRKLDKEIFADKEVRRAISQKYVFSRLEYESDEGQEFLEKYDVSGFPTLLLIDSEGRVVKRLAITFDPSEFIEQIR